MSFRYHVVGIARIVAASFQAGERFRRIYRLPAIMVTDTAPHRYPHYHTQQDTPDKIDYLRMASVVKGMERVIRELADSK